MTLDRIPVEMADAMLFDLEGNPRRLGDAWALRPVALVFVRHFG